MGVYQQCQLFGMQAKTESQIERSMNKVPSEVQTELQRLRQQLQEKDMELEEVNADLKRLAADGPTSKVCSLASIQCPQCLITCCKKLTKGVS